MEHTAEPGRLVRVPFAGTDAEGYVLERVGGSEHPGPPRAAAPRRLRAWRSSPPRRWSCAAGWRPSTPGPSPTWCAWPSPAATPGPRTPSWQPTPSSTTPSSSGTDLHGWERHSAGPAFLGHVRDGGSPRAVATSAPGTDPAALLARRGAAPRWPRGARRCSWSPTTATSTGSTRRWTGSCPRATSRLEADAGPAPALPRSCRPSPVAPGWWPAPGPRCSPRCRTSGWSRSSTTATTPTPSQRAPYPHVREVAVLRAEQDGAARPVRGPDPDRGGAAAAGVRLGPRRSLATRDVVRAASPRITVAGTSGPDAQDPLAAAARLPSDGWRVLREAVRRGPVLVQVPRTGYVPTLACQTLPRTRPLHLLPRPARGGGRGGRRLLPLVRAPGDRLGLPELRGRPLPRRGHRRPPHRRGAGPGLPRRRRAHLRRVAGPGHRPRPTPSLVISTPGRRTGRAGRVRRRAAAGRLGAAGPPRPARAGGGVPALDRRRLPGALRGRGGRRRRRRRPAGRRGAGPRALGPGRVRRAGAGPAPRARPAPRRPLRRAHRRRRRRRGVRRGAARAARGRGCSGRCPCPTSRRRAPMVRSVVRVPRSGSARWPRRSRTSPPAAACASCPPVRVRVDPLQIG